MSRIIAWFKRVAREKREYRQMEARVKALPEEYGFVFHKIQHYMWNFVAGSGMDMMRVQADLLERFEREAANGKRVLEITGEDVAAFADELLSNAKTYVENLRKSLNRDVLKKVRGES